MSKILFKYATKNRPHLFDRGMQSILNNVSNDNFHILVSVDNDDKNHYKEYPNTTIIRGESLNKVDAINRDIDLIDDWSVLVSMSDDMVFTVKGFDDIIRNEFDNLDKVLHFPDQHQGANCMTMSIIGRGYYNRDNFIYEPVFESLWVDIVAQEIAQIRGCYKFVNKNILLHLHPSFGDCQYDEQYRKTEDLGVRQRDYARYLELKKQYDKDNIFPTRSI